ncbi:MAG: formate dehydrogenase subunit delta [Sphingorhabdus sp.]
MTTVEKLVMMTNQIAANLAREADPAKATAEHIRLFWDPQMRAMIGQAGVDGLSPCAKQAIKLIQTREFE